MKQCKSATTSYSRFLILPCTVLKTLLDFATKKSQFNFYDKYYEQTDVEAVGSLVNLVLANIFMRYFEEKWIMTSDTRPSIWFRCVDETLSMYDRKETALLLILIP